MKRKLNFQQRKLLRHATTNASTRYSIGGNKKVAKPVSLTPIPKAKAPT